MTRNSQKTPKKRHWTRRCKQWRRGFFEKENTWASKDIRNDTVNDAQSHTSHIEEVEGRS